jgi:ribA/ribD-fused uncharacterized protein
MSIQQVNSLYKVTDTHIYGFFKEHKFLSNFEQCDVEYDGMVFPSSEAAYQAAKLEDKSQRAPFTVMNPTEAKKAGQNVALRKGWDTMKDEIMEGIVRQKFVNHPALAGKLLATGDKYLEETNWWGDRYWGVFMGQGKNKLGLTLMKVREELRPKN